MTCKFSEIEFGKARGELEGAALPDLLAKGFFDNRGALQSIQKGESFLVLGFKGSGKSTLGEKLRIDNEGKNTNQHVAIIHLEDFPFKNFSKIFSGQAEPEAKYPTSWSWILLLVIIDYLRQDPGARDAINIDYNNSISKLAGLGLLPTDDLKRLVIQSSKNSFKTQLFGVFEISKETTSQSADLNFMAIIESLKRLIQSYCTEGGLTVVIDGLDDILSKRDVQYQSLAALIFEVDRLNIFSKKTRSQYRLSSFAGLNFLNGFLARTRTSSGRTLQSIWIGITTQRNLPILC